MTKPEEVTVSDAEVDRFIATWRNSSTHAAIKELIAARVPDAKNPAYDDPPADQDWSLGHNACRDAVLRGGR